MNNIFKVKKIKSLYTNIKYELETFEKVNNEGVMTIISHNSLERLMHNVLMKEDCAVKYDLNFIECTEKHTVVECIIWDNKSRRISAIGESSYKSLNSDIARQYPSLTASQRAFDRAIIRYLGFEGRCYSDSEFTNVVSFDELPEEIIVNEKETNLNDDIDKIEKKTTSAVIKDDEKSEEVLIEDIVETEGIVMNESVETFQDTSEETEVSEKVTENGVDIIDEKFNVVVDIGRFKGTNKTIREIYEEDLNWYEWMITKCSSKNAENVISLMKEYKKLREGK